MSLLYRSPACQPFEYGGFLWCWFIDYWVSSALNKARENNTWVLVKYHLETGETEWESDPVSLVEWDGPGGPVDYSRGWDELITREEIDTESHTKTPHLLHGKYSLLGCTNQGALLCYDLQPDEEDPDSEPVELWRKDSRIKSDDDDTQEFFLPLCVMGGLFHCAYRKIAWTEITVNGYVWDDSWDPDSADLPPAKEDLTFPRVAGPRPGFVGCVHQELSGAPCGIVAFRPASGTEAWRWEVPEHGTLREWTHRDEGSYAELEVDDEVQVDYRYYPAHTEEFRRPGLGLIEFPPEYDDEDRLYWNGALVVSGPAVYKTISPPAEVGTGTATLFWDNLRHYKMGYDDPGGFGYGPYGTFGDKRQFDPPVSPTVEDVELREDGPGSPTWDVTWYSVYLGQTEVAASGSISPHSLTSVCASPYGIICGPRSSVVDASFESHSAVWRRIHPAGDIIWLKSSSASDNGSKHVRLTGLDSGGCEIGEDVVLNGTEYVTSSLTYMGGVTMDLQLVSDSSEALASGDIEASVVDIHGNRIAVGLIAQGESTGESKSSAGSPKWTTEINVTADGRGWKVSAPLCIGERIYTAIWEYEVLGSWKGTPRMIVLHSKTGEILEDTEIPSNIFNKYAEAVRVGFELVLDGSSIYVQLGSKSFRYGTST